MTTFDQDPLFDPRISDWLEADPDHAPEIVLDTVAAAFPSIPQRRASRMPWRFPAMSTFAKVAATAVAVIVIGTVGIIALQPGSGGTVGSPPSPSPSPSPTPARSMPPPLTETFTSSMNGISIAYPAEWRTRAATQPWTAKGWPGFGEPTGDFMYDGSLTDHLFIVLASQPLGDKTGDRWAADNIAADDCTPTGPVTIDGASGLVSVDCGKAAFALDGRGYLVVFYTSGDDPWLGEVYDRAWFEHLLTTIDLHPEDAASASPSAAE